jgi:hypothetical protein
MASPKQAANMNMQGWQQGPSSAPKQPPNPPEPSTSLRHPNMLASMPLMASTGDAFQRQFYGGANVPTYRILPAKKGSGA